MEYTKDAVFNIHYTNNVGMMKFKKWLWLNKIKNILKDNKFIVLLLVSISLLIAIDIALVNAFMNLIITL